MREKSEAQDAKEACETWKAHGRLGPSGPYLQGTDEDNWLQVSGFGVTF